MSANIYYIYNRLVRNCLFYGLGLSSWVSIAFFYDPSFEQDGPTFVLEIECHPSLVRSKPSSKEIELCQQAVPLTMTFFSHLVFSPTRQQSKKHYATLHTKQQKRCADFKCRSCVHVQPHANVDSFPATRTHDNRLWSAWALTGTKLSDGNICRVRSRTLFMMLRFIDFDLDPAILYLIPAGSVM